MMINYKQQLQDYGWMNQIVYRKEPDTDANYAKVLAIYEEVAQKSLTPMVPVSDFEQSPAFLRLVGLLFPRALSSFMELSVDEDGLPIIYIYDETPLTKDGLFASYATLCTDKMTDTELVSFRELFDMYMRDEQCQIARGVIPTTRMLLEGMVRVPEEVFSRSILPEATMRKLGAPVEYVMSSKEAHARAHAFDLAFEQLVPGYMNSTSQGVRTLVYRMMFPYYRTPIMILSPNGIPVVQEEGGSDTYDMLACMLDTAHFMVEVYGADGLYRAYSNEMAHDDLVQNGLRAHDGFALHRTDVQDDFTGRHMRTSTYSFPVQSTSQGVVKLRMDNIWRVR